MSAGDARGPSAWSSNPMLRAVVVLLAIGALLAVVPLWPALLLAAWVGHLARPLLRKVAHVVGRRERAAALVTVGLILTIMLPLVGLVFAVVSEGIDLYHDMQKTGLDKSFLLALVAPGANGGAEMPPIGVKEMIDLGKSYGERAWQLAVLLGGTAASVIIGVVVFFWGTYAMLSGEPKGLAWLEKHGGVPSVVVRRLYAAFMETGRGLFVGVGATSFVQAAVATATFVALGVKRAILLGALTLVMSLIPALGSGIVWVPVAIGLAVSGSPVKAAILVAVGILVIGTVDNLVRPFFARYGALQMSTFALFVAMLGGIAIFGTFGILLGPLLVRLAREALEIRTEMMSGEPHPEEGEGARVSDPEPTVRDPQRPRVPVQLTPFERTR